MKLKRALKKHSFVHHIYLGSTSTTELASKLAFREALHHLFAISPAVSEISRCSKSMTLPSPHFQKAILLITENKHNKTKDYKPVNFIIIQFNHLIIQFPNHLPENKFY